jgi:hypothetical protein
MAFILRAASLCKIAFLQFVLKNKQEVCFSDYTTRMSRRNDSDFLKRAGSRCETVAFLLVTFLSAKQRKVTRQKAKKVSLNTKHLGPQP